ncbi:MULTISPECIES: helix-turn-helix transcriptional regulator [unclassified Clostridium]|uniref:helix-turn-helix domain-containing protein n=1 Tax=unclassified Clostridium TaxID=2614128 RepID=UPI000297E059|nr:MULTISPECIES: helix-turn-helix transcriptional regulator [unclassified Clostridium]EKQ56330.1 MAG: putative transcription factor, MBF1 like protein [Clostridium sp. Maddingley MBC34-26]
MDIGTKIKTLRETAGISLRKLAELSNIAPSHLSYIESNKTNPTIEKLDSICKALNISLIQFLSDNELEPIALTPDLKELLESAKHLSSSQIEALKITAKVFKEGR